MRSRDIDITALRDPANARAAGRGGPSLPRAAWVRSTVSKRCAQLCAERCTCSAKNGGTPTSVGHKYAFGNTEERLRLQKLGCTKRGHPSVPSKQARPARPRHGPRMGAGAAGPLRRRAQRQAQRRGDLVARDHWRGLLATRRRQAAPARALGCLSQAPTARATPLGARSSPSRRTTPNAYRSASSRQIAAGFWTALAAWPTRSRARKSRA